MEGDEIKKSPPMFCTIGELFEETQDFVKVCYHRWVKEEDALECEDANEYICVPKGWLVKMVTVAKL